MSHTPTPWDKTIARRLPKYLAPDSKPIVYYIIGENDLLHSIACVNACEGMEDPWADILAMSTDLSVGKSIMDEKDTEIAELKARVKELVAQQANNHNPANRNGIAGM